MPVSHSENSETTILSLIKNNKAEQAFDTIVGQYQERLYWHIRKIVISHDDTDDVLQNAFIKIWNNLKNFRGDSQLFTWLYRIATNEALSFLKKKQRRSIIPLVSSDYDLSETLESDAYFNANEAQKKLQKILLELPDKQRLVFNMKYFEEMKYDDMADILETSVGALKASYHHAVKKIEKYLSEG